MIKILLFTITILPLQTFANNCESYYSFQTEKILQRCVLEHEGKAIEMAKLKGHCSKIEGAPKKDCYLIRDCPADENARYSQAPMILSEYLQDDSYCDQGKDNQVLNQETKKISATIKCKSKKPTSVELKISNQIKICKFE